MGSDNTNVAFSESPAHKVTLTQDYLMGETEVTEALWNAVMGNGGGSNTRPKTSVTWNEAHTFADRLTEIAQEQGLISDGMRFRLPRHSGNLPQKAAIKAKVIFMPGAMTSTKSPLL